MEYREHGDIYGRAGMVFVWRGGDTVLFGLSCRALGREVEGRMIDFVRQRHMIKGIDFVPTGKNGCLKELLGREFPQIIWCKNNQKPAYNLLCIHSLMQLVFG